MFQESLEAADGDRWFFKDLSRKQALEAAMRDWPRQGLDAVKWELVDVYQPWGFRLAEIAIPVTIWFGSQDPRVKHVDFQARTIPDATVTSGPIAVT